MFSVQLVILYIGEWAICILCKSSSAWILFHTQKESHTLWAPIDWGYFHCAARQWPQASFLAVQELFGEESSYWKNHQIWTGSWKSGAEIPPEYLQTLFSSWPQICLFVCLFFLQRFCDAFTTNASLCHFGVVLFSPSIRLSYQCCTICFIVFNVRSNWFLSMVFMSVCVSQLSGIHFHIVRVMMRKTETDEGESDVTKMRARERRMKRRWKKCSMWEKWRQEKQT